MESVTPQQSPPRVHYQPERDRWACWTGRRRGAAVREQLQGGKTQRPLSPAGVGGAGQTGSRGLPSGAGLRTRRLGKQALHDWLNRMWLNLDVSIISIEEKFSDTFLLL